MSRRRSDEVPLNLFSFQDIITSVSGIIILVTLLLGLNVATSNSSGGAAAQPVRVPDRSAEVARLEARLADLRQQMQARAKPRDTATAAGPASSADVLRALIAEDAQLRQKLADSEAALTRTTGAHARLADELQRLEEELAKAQAWKKDLPANVWLRPDQPTDAPVILAECAGSSIRCATWGEQGPGPARSFAATEPRGRSDFVAYTKALAARDPRSKLVLLLRPSAIRYALELVQQVQDAGIAVGYDALEEGLSIFPRSQP